MTSNLHPNWLRPADQWPQPVPVPPSAETFAEALSALLRARGITARQLAQRADISVHTVSTLTTGRNAPSLGVLAAICRVFDVHRERLIDAALTDADRSRRERGEGAA